MKGTLILKKCIGEKMEFFGVVCSTGFFKHHSYPYELIEEMFDRDFNRMWIKTARGETKTASLNAWHKYAKKYGYAMLIPAGYQY